jgi:hypothetical protein
MLQNWAGTVSDTPVRFTRWRIMSNAQRINWFQVISLMQLETTVTWNQYRRFRLEKTKILELGYN